MKASRLVNLMLLLQNRDRMTARQIAAELEVSIRTVHRDVDALAQAGVPIYAERGAVGGIRLMDGYRTRLTGLTLDEADSLFLTGMPGPAGELGLGEVVAAAQLKVLAALPDHLRQRADRLRHRFLLDPGGWFQEPVQLPWLTALAEAVWNQRGIRMTYQRWGKTDNIVTRDLDPLGVVLKAGVWYLMAAPDGAPRMYRVSKILDLVVDDRVFTYPPGFDLASAWAQCAREFEARIYTATMTVRISDVGLERIQAFLSPFQVSAIRSAIPVIDDDGWGTVDVPVESIDHALWDVLKMAPHMEVLSPLELRQRVAETANTLAERHR
ncbi:MAG: WYL domain-containing protein [Chloroflexia bacterium]|nr:WYL domain-containing protein [Chloroflexia bacterium]